MAWRARKSDSSSRRNSELELEKLEKKVRGGKYSSDVYLPKKKETHVQNYTKRKMTTDRSYVHWRQALTGGIIGGLVCSVILSALDLFFDNTQYNVEKRITDLEENSLNPGKLKKLLEESFNDILSNDKKKTDKQELQNKIDFLNENLEKDAKFIEELSTLLLSKNEISDKDLTDILKNERLRAHLSKKTLEKLFLIAKDPTKNSKIRSLAIKPLDSLSSSSLKEFEILINLSTDESAPQEVQNTAKFTIEKIHERAKSNE